MAKGLAREHHINNKTQIFPAQSQKNPMVSLNWRSFNNIWLLTLKLSNFSTKSSKEGQRAIFSINPIIFFMIQSQIYLYSWFTWWMNVGLWGWLVHLPYSLYLHLNSFFAPIFPSKDCYDFSMIFFLKLHLSQISPSLRVKSRRWSMVFFSPRFSNNGFNAFVRSLDVRDLKEMMKKKRCVKC